MLPAADGGLGVFGGTFDPLHTGHLIAAQDVLEALVLDRVLFVPAWRSPLKSQESQASPASRLRMVESAIQGDPRFEVSAIEIERGGPSYTVETLRELSSERPGTRFVLILGADQWAQFGDWHQPGEITSLVELALMTRSGDRPLELDSGFEGGAPTRHTEVSVTRTDVSASLVRNRVREGRSIRYLVPEPVRRIIEGDNLYLKVAEGE